MASRGAEALVSVDRDHGTALAIVTERLTEDFPEHAAIVGAFLADAYSRTREAAVQSYRVLLAEREARAALRSLTAGDRG